MKKVEVEEGEPAPKRGKQKNYYGTVYFFCGLDHILLCFRTSNNNIVNICKGFFLDSSHLAFHFAYITKTQDLTPVVEKNLVTQVGMISNN